MAIREHSIEKNAQAGMDGVVLQVKKLERKPAGSDAGLLAGISMHVAAGELVVVAGPCKSALLETLAGLRAPDGGQILINGADFYPNRKILAGYVGYVPPVPALHDCLTVEEVLRYEAGLRLADQSKERLQYVLELTGLQAAASQPVCKLRLAEQRLLRIGVELLSPPGLLLVDEAVQAMPPAEAMRIFALLSGLARLGLTVLLASDLPSAAAQADKMAVLAPDGTLAWFGPAPDAIEYFRSINPGAESLSSSFSLESALETPLLTQSVEGKSLGQVFMDQPYYQKYISGPLSGKRSDLVLEDRPLTRFRGDPEEGQLPPPRPQPSLLTKTTVLAGRSFVTMLRTRRLALLLAAPILLALTNLLFATRSMNDRTLGDPRGQPVALGMLVFLNVLTAALLFQNEVQSERGIIRYERRSLRLAFPYALSKLLWLALFSVYAGLIWAVIHFLATGLWGGPAALGGYAVTFVLVAFIGGALGLLASTLSRTALAASTLVMLFILPQFLLSGSVIPQANLAQVVRPLTWANPARYAFDILLTISGYGRDVVADTCWQMPKEARANLNDEDKEACDCMGQNVFSDCEFPGIYRQILPPLSIAIEQKNRPNPPGGDPLREDPPAPPQPQPGQSPEEFQQAVEAYNREISLYLANVDDYHRELQDYLPSLESWQQNRSLAIGIAEGGIADALDHYGNSFNVPYKMYWLVLAGFSLALVVILLIVIAR